MFVYKRGAFIVAFGIEKDSRPGSIADFWRFEIARPCLNVYLCYLCGGGCFLYQNIYDDYC